MRSRTAVLLAGVAVLAGCGSDGGEAGGGEERRASGRDPFAVVDRARRPDGTRRPAAPRWERVARLRGTQDDARSVAIAPSALQWRVRWSCGRGRLRIVARGDGGRTVRGASECPRGGEASGVQTGRVALDVTATGAWQAVVEQQVDTPLREPPLPAVRSGAARRLGVGRFYRLDRRGSGRALLHRLPSGRLALRFEDFETAASADLFVWVSRAPRPRTSREALTSAHVDLGPLRATAGSQNYVLPRDLTVADARSVVLWCEPLRIAYAAAALSQG